MLLLVLAACAKHPTAPPPEEDMLYQVEGFFPRKPDSALQILDALNVSVLSEKEQAHYCLLKVQVRDRFFLYDEETDSLMQVAENYFIGGKDKWFEANTCEALSRIAFKEGKGEQIKLDWLLKAFQSIEQCRHVDERLLRYPSKNETEQERIDGYKCKIQMRLGMCYIDNDYTREGLQHLKAAERHFAETQNYNMCFATANMLASGYLELKEYDSCKMYLEKGLEFAHKLGQAENIAFYHCSMSELYLYQYDNQEYVNEGEEWQLLKQAIEECWLGLALYEDAMFKYKDGFYNNLSKAYYRLEQYDSCIYYAEKQIDFMDALHFEIVPNIENAALFYRLYKSYEALGDQQRALEYANRYFEMQQAIESQPKAVEQVKNEYDKKLEMNKLQSEQQIKRYRLYLLLALVVVVLVVVLWLSNRYRKDKEIEILRQEEAYNKLQSEFDATSQQTKQALQQRVMELYKSKKEDSLQHILSEFSVAYPQAMEKLQVTHPNLTESERNIVILSFLGFRTKEEAEILHLSLNTVEKYRTNIRKKASHDPISDLTR